MEFVNGIPLCHGAEALVRWNSKEYGLVTPEGFISEAENLRLMDSIGSFVITEAIKSCKHWNDFGFPEYGVGINLSPYQLSQKDILETIKSVIKKTDINPANITFEVTEPVSTEDVSWMVKILTAIRELGCKIALDDYGKAGSSLMNIRVMPIDIIKIDKKNLHNRSLSCGIQVKSVELVLHELLFLLTKYHQIGSIYPLASPKGIRVAICIPLILLSTGLSFSQYSSSSSLIASSFERLNLKQTGLPVCH